mmetsp:Transcript_90112/g.156025  ORF Transcript_90112/g.156025 Transcript_90112/m.156025 type:complete len:97 (+) Transcript_90112:158-448(+)
MATEDMTWHGADLCHGWDLEGSVHASKRFGPGRLGVSHKVYPLKGCTLWDTPQRAHLGLQSASLTTKLAMQDKAPSLSSPHPHARGDQRPSLLVAR